MMHLRDDTHSTVAFYASIFKCIRVYAVGDEKVNVRDKALVKAKRALTLGTGDVNQKRAKRSLSLGTGDMNQKWAERNLT